MVYFESGSGKTTNSDRVSARRRIREHRYERKETL
jgi:hypothetical protein